MVKKPTLPLIGLAIAISAALTACGGGGGGGGGNDASAAATAPEATAPSTTPSPTAPTTPAPKPPTIADAQGLYEATISNRLGGMIVLDTGRYYMLYADALHPEFVAGVLVGDMAIGAGGATFTSANLRDYNFETMNRFYGNLAGTFTPKGHIEGTATSGTAAVGYAGTYSDAYEQPATQPAVAGAYSGRVGTRFGVEGMALKVQASGALEGSSQTGCNISGALTPRDGRTAIYNLQVTFGSGCKLAGTSYSGHAVLTRGNLLRAVAGPADLSDIVVFVGNKPAGSVQ